jgi:putative membrane protein insertion efficiency factor
MGQTKPRRLRRLRRAALLLAACLVGAGAWDLARPPASQWSAAAAVSAIHVYQRTASPLLSRFGGRCRFRPTCSRYAELVIQKQGLLKGGWRTAKRIARCGPWTPLGTEDVP